MTTTVSEFRREQQISSVRVASESNVAGTYYNGPSNSGVGATLTISASSLTIDGVACAVNDRVLLFAQTSEFQNGIYMVQSIGATVVLERAYDFQEAAQMVPGYYMPVEAGSEFAGAVFTVVEPQVQVVGVDDIVINNAGSSISIATFSNTGLRIENPAGTFLTTVVPTTAITANRQFSIATGDANRTLNISAADVTVSAFGATLVDDAAASNARTTLELGSANDVAFNSLTLPNTGLHLLDSNASHDLIIAPGSDLTADRQLTLTTGDAARNLSILADVALDQNLQIADSPVFAGVTVANTGLHVLDTNASHDLVIVPGSDLTADRNFTITTGDAARTLDVSAANVTVSTFGASLVDDAANLNALTTLGLARGDSDTWGGGGTSFAFTCAGVVATDIVLVSLIAAANNVAVTKCVAGAGIITVDFTADPGAGTIVNFLAIPTV